MKIKRESLTRGQKGILERWESDGKPTEVVKLGYSCGCRGNNNFHSTWAFRSGEIIRIYGDSRNAWRGMIRRYGYDQVA